MELGNLFFGNSRGNHSVPRNDSWQEPIFELMESIEKGCSPYGTFFENDIFSMRKYWWGDCDCGADAPTHQDDCDMITRWDAWMSKCIKYCTVHNCWDREEEYSKLNPAPFCTCGAEENFIEQDECNPNCSTIKPNFLYKPTGLEIRWYKYALRDSYTNQKITLEQFNKIIQHSKNSLIT